MMTWIKNLVLSSFNQIVVLVGIMGIKDISDKLASQNYNRLKIGVGKEGSTHDHVLVSFRLRSLIVWMSFWTMRVSL